MNTGHTHPTNVQTTMSFPHCTPPVYESSICIVIAGIVVVICMSSRSLRFLLFHTSHPKRYHNNANAFTITHIMQCVCSYGLFEACDSIVYTCGKKERARTSACESSESETINIYMKSNLAFCRIAFSSYKMFPCILKCLQRKPCCTRRECTQYYSTYVLAAGCDERVHKQ